MKSRLSRDTFVKQIEKCRSHLSAVTQANDSISVLESISSDNLKKLVAHET